jgi:hypothetical protein
MAEIEFAALQYNGFIVAAQHLSQGTAPSEPIRPRARWLCNKYF